jgi:RND family efflux transporter MFP subunit
VSAARAERRPVFRAGIDLTGDVKPFDQLRLLSKVAGRIEELRARQCDRVAAGQPVALIERDMTEAQVEAAEAGISVAKAQLAAAKANLDSAATNADRLRALFEKGSVTQQQLDGAETALRAALAQRDLAQAQIEQLEANLRLAKIQLDECTVRSAMSGVVVDDFDHTVGEIIAPQVPIFEVADLGKVRVEVRISEEDLGRVVRGQAAIVRVARFPGREFTGDVWRISPVVDRRSRTAEVEVLVTNPKADGDYALKPGMFARVTVVTASEKDVVVVPQESVQSADGETRVFVVDGVRAVMVPVSVVMNSGRETAVRGGLKGGELVVSEGASLLRDGDAIEVEGGAQ